MLHFLARGTSRVGKGSARTQTPVSAMQTFMPTRQKKIAVDHASCSQPAHELSGMPQGFGLRQSSGAFDRSTSSDSGRGLPQSKTLSRQPLVPGRAPRACAVPAVVLALTATLLTPRMTHAEEPTPTRPLRDLNKSYFPFTPVAGEISWKARHEEVQRRLLVAAGLYPMP